MASLNATRARMSVLLKGSGMCEVIGGVGIATPAANSWIPERGSGIQTYTMLVLFPIPKGLADIMPGQARQRAGNAGCYPIRRGEIEKLKRGPFARKHWPYVYRHLYEQIY